MLAFERIAVRGARGRRARARAAAEEQAAWRRAFWWGAAAAFAATLGIVHGARAGSSTGPRLTVEEPLPAGGPIVVLFSGLPAGQDDWITVVPEEYGEAAYDDWIGTGGRAEGVVALPGRAPGTYAIRAFDEHPSRHLIAEIKVIVPRLPTPHITPD